jgi:RimJ/RimL family protein N-acetyltransferase
MRTLRGLATPAREAGRSPPGLRIRAAAPPDRHAIATFNARLSQASRYLRFLHGIRELPAAQIDAMLAFEPRQAVTLLAVRDGAGGEIIGIAQYAATDDAERCEVAVAVADAWHRQGIASRLLQALSRIGRAAGFRTACAETFRDNLPAMRLARRWHATVEAVPGNASIAHLRVDLDRVPAGRLASAQDETRSRARLTA